MAGDWIKIEHATPDKPEIHEMAEHLSVDANAVLGACIRVWIWADQQSQDGACRGTKAVLDRLASIVGFSAAMEKVGWISIGGGCIRFANFDQHNSDSAKKRAATAKRVARHRDGNASVTQKCYNGNASVTHVCRAIARPIRRAVFERDNNTCVYCGRRDGEYAPPEISNDGVLSIDHVIPRTRGGSETPENLVTCCVSCNNSKNNRTPDECGFPWPVDVNGKRYGSVTASVTSALQKRYSQRYISVTREEKSESESESERRASPSLSEEGNHSLEKVNGRGSPSHSQTSRQSARMVWLSQIEPLFGRERKQRLSDKTSSERLFDDLIWPEEVDIARGSDAYRTALSAIKRSTGRGNRMAWITAVLTEDLKNE